MNYFSLVSLFAVLALIPGCCKNGSCYRQESCCPTTHCETAASSQLGEMVTEAPAMSEPQHQESIEIEEELDEKEDLSADKEDLDGNDDSQSAQA